MYKLKKNYYTSKKKNIFDDIDIHNFKIGTVIGKGQYATVRNCCLKQQ